MPVLTTIDGGLIIQTLASSPDTVTTASRGSITIRTDASNAGIWINTDGATAWTQLVGVGGTTTFTTATTWTLLDASATALVIGASGAASMMTFDTTNSAETIAFACRVTTTDGVSAGTARVVGGRASSTTADSGTITGNGAAQSFSQTYAIPANTLKSGSLVKVYGGVRRTGINAADTATVIVRIGGTTYLTSPAVAAAAGDRCNFWLAAVARAAPGAAVTVAGTGCSGWSTAAAIQLAAGNSAALATNGALTVDVQINMANNPGNTAVLETFFVEII